MPPPEESKEATTPLAPIQATQGVTVTGPAATDRYIGSRIKDRYTIERELGRGGFGVAYLARDERLSSKPVVIKILLKHAGPGDWFGKKFLEERKALARLDHPGIVGVLDCGEETPDGKPFLVMQYVDGITLREALQARSLPLERVGRLVRQIGQALSAAHDRGVYHRDLKPENIMLQDLGRGEELVKIIDFGIATVKEQRTAGESETTRVAGSGPYMSPEQLLGKPTAASDVYSLGVIAFELLTGKRPFEPGSLVEQYYLQKEGVREKPTDLRPGLPPGAEDCILKALAFEESRRYQRARDFGDDLALALTARSTQIAKIEPASPAEPELSMAHVLFMDVVAYSILPTDRQTQVLQQLHDCVRRTKAFRRAEADQELVRLPTGDGMALVFFGDPTAPAQCAIEIARALNSSPDLPLPLRMGIHSGPVYRIADINANNNVAGGGINIAQRVMNHGDAGHILLSRTVAEVLLQLSEWAPSLHDLGEHSMKHGAPVQIFNLHTKDAGNPEIPAKLRALNSTGRWRKRWVNAIIVATIAALGVAIAGLIQRIHQDRAPAALLAPVTERLFHYSIEVQDATGKTFLLPREMLFPPGYGIRFLISSPQMGYLYIFNEGPQPGSNSTTLNILFPGERESALVAPNITVEVPEKPGWLRLDAAQGTERLWMVWSIRGISNLEQAKAFGNTTYRGAVYDPLRQAVLAFLNPYRNSQIAVEKDEVNRQFTVRGKSDILVNLLELEHH